MKIVTLKRRQEHLRSFNAGLWTMGQVLIVATVFAALLIAVAWYSRSLPLVLAIALLYIVVTTWEKLSYGRGVLSYKAIITKLVRRLGALDSGGAE